MKSGFVVVFYRSDENFDTTGTDTTPVTIPVNTPDKDIRSKFVSLCLNAPQTREQLMQACGMKYCYTYEEKVQPKNIPVFFRMYQLNFTVGDEFVYKKYWNMYSNHFIEDI